MPLTTKERLTAIANHLRDIRRENIRTFARLKALESMIARSIPEQDREKWDDELDKITAEIHQQRLESLEKGSPAFAADLDDRDPNELRLLE